MTDKQTFWKSQADTWAMRRRDGATFERIASDSNVSIPTVRTRLVSYGYSLKGEIEGGDPAKSTPGFVNATAQSLQDKAQSTTTNAGGAN